MRIFLAGGTGAIGRRLVPLLVDRGHEVIATTRRESATRSLRDAGAEPIVLDPLDRDAVVAAVVAAKPDVIVHELTALGGDLNLRKFDKAFAMTNRLRTEGTDNLIAAALAAGTRRFVAQSFAGWPFQRTGSWVKSEDAPLDPEPPKQMATTLAAIRHLESVVTGTDGIDGIALRYGGFYGPGSGIAPDGDQLEMVRKRRFPLVGSAAGMASFVHLDDAALATALAAEGSAVGIYHIVDDEPAPESEWLPELAKAAGAKPPRHIPAWLARIVAGNHMVKMMEQGRGASNAKARRELGWAPAHASWRDGFKETIAGEVEAAA